MHTLTLVVDAYLLGLAVTVALVVYPAFALVGDAEWPQYHARHSARITWAVAPAWALQGAVTLWWLLSSRYELLALVHGAAALAGVVTTVIGAVPAHNRLSPHRDETALRHLRHWHAARTLAWAVALVAAVLA